MQNHKTPNAQLDLTIVYQYLSIILSAHLSFHINYWEFSQSTLWPDLGPVGPAADQTSLCLTLAEGWRWRPSSWPWRWRRRPRSPPRWPPQRPSGWRRWGTGSCGRRCRKSRPGCGGERSLKLNIRKNGTQRRRESGEEKGEEEWIDERLAEWKWMRPENNSWKKWKNGVIDHLKTMETSAMNESWEYEKGNENSQWFLKEWNGIG